MLIVESREEPVSRAGFIAPIILATPCYAVVIREEHTSFAACQPTVGVNGMECRLMHTVVTGEPERIAVVVPRLSAVVTDFDMAFKDNSFSTVVDDVGTRRVKTDKSCRRVRI